MSRVGFEPTTHGLKGRCSATELPAHPLGAVIIRNVRWERIWYPRDPLGKALSLALTPLSWIYAAGWQVYLQAYRSGLKRQFVPPLPTVCVGNLEVGGSGKTPIAIALVRMLKEIGYSPALSLSGYGSAASQGVTPLAPEQPVEALIHGDESALARAKLPDVPLLIGRRRTEAAKLAPTLGADVLVLDDGFQHLPLARTLDLIVWQPERTNRRCLPAGPLREPEANVRRAAALLLPSGATPPPYGLPAFFYERRFGPLRCIQTNATVSVQDAPKRVVAVSAIARPERFRASLESLGFEVEEELVFPDHSSLSHARFDDRKTYVCTEKDAVKLKDREDLAQVFALESDVEFVDSDALVAFLRPKLEEAK
ncbi:MAG: tetraacyldisaccharide 4'-kinase [Fimbriimonadales bacterium]|nr:MAG: tetraacyldisaccharide 4'-kinase [Fimbriimonadales bacterium]